MVVLSTGHMPETHPDIGEIRSVDHEYGYILFVNPGLARSDVPDWIGDIWEHALEMEASVILFDCDGDLVPGLKAYDW